MATKKYDVAVKIGSYEKDGETKGKYLNIGVVLEGDNGLYMLLDRTFNPAGVLNPQGRETVLLSFFDPKSKGNDTPGM